MYVAVRQRLVVNLFSLFVAEVVAVHPVHVREGGASSVFVAAGQRYLQRCSDRDGPVIACGPEDSSFDIEGIAEHISQAEFL